MRLNSEYKPIVADISKTMDDLKHQIDLAKRVDVKVMHIKIDEIESLANVTKRLCTEILHMFEMDGQ